MGGGDTATVHGRGGRNGSGTNWIRPGVVSFDSMAVHVPDLLTALVMGGFRVKSLKIAVRSLVGQAIGEWSLVGGEGLRVVRVSHGTGGCMVAVRMKTGRFGLVSLSS